MDKKTLGRFYLTKFHKLLVEVMHSPYTQGLISDYISEIIRQLQRIIPLWEQVILVTEQDLTMPQRSYSKLTSALILTMDEMSNIGRVSATSNVFMKIFEAERNLHKLVEIVIDIKAKPEAKAV